MTTTRYRIGADENGLGPRLGPMLVTGVLAEVDERGHKTVEKKARGKMKARIGDSKDLMKHGDVAVGEAWARVLVERAGHDASSPDALVRALALDAVDVLTTRCPDHVRHQCWGHTSEPFVAEAALIKDVRKDLAKLEASGVRLVAAKSAIVCAKHLNAEIDKGLSRFHVDLHHMERLVMTFRERAGADVLAVCGKVGGLMKYEPAFGPLGGRLLSVLSEKREKSAYFFPGVGEIRFVMDADAGDRLVSIASLVGKYMRELLMARIVHHYRGDDPELPDASGYHDPVTEIFVERTALVRKKRKVPGDCFERRSLG
jgi:ribonuclease HII